MRTPHEDAPTRATADRGPRVLRFGYGTNGFANHPLTDALAVLADLGYEGVALTLDHDHLDLFAPELARRTAEVASTLGRLGLAVVIETGARYLLDPWHKHAPTLLHDEPARRLEFLRRAVQVGADLGAPPGFGITLDIGHCRCLEPLPVPECVRAVADHLVNVQIDDMRRGVHEHLEFGTGEIDFPPALAALAEAGYAGLVAVELPRHSHAAPAVAARSIEFLRRAAACGQVRAA